MPFLRNARPVPPFHHGSTLPCRLHVLRCGGGQDSFSATLESGRPGPPRYHNRNCANKGSGVAAAREPRAHHRLGQAGLLIPLAACGGPASAPASAPASPRPQLDLAFTDYRGQLLTSRGREAQGGAGLPPLPRVGRGRSAASACWGGARGRAQPESGGRHVACLPSSAVSSTPTLTCRSTARTCSRPSRNAQCGESSSSYTATEDVLVRNAQY